MNKSRARKVPPLLVDNRIVSDCREKAKLFNDFFSNQCTFNVNDSILPNFNFVTNKRLSLISIRNNEIVSLICNINPNKAAGPDGISGHMIQLCDDSIACPLEIIFENILTTCNHPDISKTANITLVFKKGNKLLVKNYRPISLLHMCKNI